MGIVERSLHDAEEGGGDLDDFPNVGSAGHGGELDHPEHDFPDVLRLDEHVALQQVSRHVEVLQSVEQQVREDLRVLTYFLVRVVSFPGTGPAAVAAAEVAVVLGEHPRVSVWQ